MFFRAPCPKGRSRSALRATALLRRSVDLRRAVKTNVDDWARGRLATNRIVSLTSTGLSPVEVEIRLLSVRIEGDLL